MMVTPMTTKTEADIEREDLASLLGQSSFKRFLWRVVKASGIHTSAYGSDDRRLNSFEGRRSLGFDMLRWAEDALRIGDGDGMAALAILLSEASGSKPPSPTEDRNARLPRYDRNRELDADED